MSRRRRAHHVRAARNGKRLMFKHSLPICYSFTPSIKMKNEQTKMWLGGHNAFVRGLAAFFLLFAFADMAFPQVFCREELGGLLNVRQDAASKSESSSIAREKSVVAVNDEDDSRQNDPSREAPHEEDCFCCCAHVLAGLNFQPNVLGAVKPLPFILYQDSIPNPPLRGTDRPPRIA